MDRRFGASERFSLPGDNRGGFARHLDSRVGAVHHIRAADFRDAIRHHTAPAGTRRLARHLPHRDLAERPAGRGFDPAAFHAAVDDAVARTNRVIVDDGRFVVHDVNLTRRQVVRAQAPVAEVLPGHKREVRGRKAEPEVRSHMPAAERPADAD